MSGQLPGDKWIGPLVSVVEYLGKGPQLVRE
jgi:hypothetical protein